MRKLDDPERGVAVRHQAPHIAPRQFRLLKLLQIEGQTLQLGAL
jgi:hypothetical protein